MNANDETSESGSVVEPNPALMNADARERLILALLQEPSLQKAAAAAGMSLTMAYRLKRTPEFEREFRKARNEAFGDVMSHLQWASGMAVAVLSAALRGRTTSMKDRLRAAEILLNHAAEARTEELDALVEHVENLREANSVRRRNGT